MLLNINTLYIPYHTITPAESAHVVYQFNNFDVIQRYGPCTAVLPAGTMFGEMTLLHENSLRTGADYASRARVCVCV
jgi:hypothetical protein